MLPPSQIKTGSLSLRFLLLSKARVWRRYHYNRPWPKNTNNFNAILYSYYVKSKVKRLRPPLNKTPNAMFINRGNYLNRDL
jgi:hypothetical protein